MKLSTVLYMLAMLAWLVAGTHFVRAFDAQYCLDNLIKANAATLAAITSDK